MNSRYTSHRSRMAALLCLVAALISLCGRAQAQSSVLLDEVRTIAAPDHGVPIERTFPVSTAGTYQVTLTDLGKAATPSAPLASVKLAITSGSTVVGTPLAAAGTTQFTATAGSYVVRVIGAPGPVAGSGAFGVQITNTADSSVLFGFSDSLALPAAATPNVAQLQDTFTVSASDTYTISLTDLQFPAFLNTVQLAVTAQNALVGTPLVISNGSPAAALQMTATLQPNTTYNIASFAQAATTANAGLYTVVVRNSTGAVAYSRTVTVGALTSLGKVPLTAGSYTLSFTDLALPAALSATGPNLALIALDDQAAARLTTFGTRAFTAVAGNYQVFALGTAAATPGAGSYDVEVQPATGPAAFSLAQAVVVSGGALQAYTFSTDIATAGTYNVQLADYQIPQALMNVSMAAVQGGASLATPLTAAGTLNVSAATGKLSILVFSTPQTAGGVFGLFVTPGAGGASIFGTTQGVGALFTSRKVTVTAAGSYVVKVTDVGFPVPFSTLDVLVTQGPTLVGSILGYGSLPPFAATPGDYYITFTAQPGGSDKAGTYAINVAPPPPAPVVNFTSDPTHVASGGSAALNWTSQNAASCTASDGWSGTQNTSGSASTGGLTVDTKFTLTCIGTGGSTTQSITVTIDHPAAPGGGGGGALDLALLAALAGFLVRRAAGDCAARRVA